MAKPLQLLVSFVLLGAEVTASNSSMDNLQYVGCFDIMYALVTRYYHEMPGLTLEACVEKCMIENPAHYIGVETDDDSCYCGGDIAEASIRRNDTQCNVLCSEKHGNRTCGGTDWVMSVYHLSNTYQGSRDEPLFLIGSSSDVMMLNTSRQQFDAVMQTGNRWAVNVDYHFEKRLIFSNVGNTLVKATLTPAFVSTSTTPVVVLKLNACAAFAVDWLHDWIYWADCQIGRPPLLMRTDLGGEDQKIVGNLLSYFRNVKRMEVDPYSRMLFWLADGIIESLDFTDLTVRGNVSAAGVVVRALALDIAMRRLFYVGHLGQRPSLFCVDYRSNNNIEIFSTPQMDSVYGLGLLWGFVYWVNYDTSTDVIYKAPLKINGGSSSLLLKTIDKAVWHMRLVHPELQNNATRRNPCVTRGCSHFCEVLTPLTAVCRCPEGVPLEGDHVTCTSFRSGIATSHQVTTVDSAQTIPPPATTSHTRQTEKLQHTTFLGCVHHDIHLMHGSSVFMSPFSVDECVLRCERQRRNIVGISKSDGVCYCSASMSSETVDDDLCSDVCPEISGPDIRCGGNSLLSLYELEIKPVKEKILLASESKINATELVLVGAFVAALVLLVAVLLLYMTDMKEVLWARLAGAPYVRERTRQRDGLFCNPAEDTANLT